MLIKPASTTLTVGAGPASNTQPSAKTAAEQLPRAARPLGSDNWVMNYAKADAVAASKFAEGLTFGYDQPEVDITEWSKGTGPVRYTKTGQPVTPEATRELEATAAKLREGRISVFNAEKAKGASDVEIIGKVINYMDQNAPSDHLKSIDWDRISGRTHWVA